MKAKELRDAVLQLAIQGKLVPQDKNDEPASELIKRIKAEKEQLIKEKKIKKQKALSPITEDEIPFDIPDSWEWVRLNDYCMLDNGKKCKNISLPYLNAKYLRRKEDRTLKKAGIVVEKATYIILVDGQNSGEVFVVPERGVLGSTFKILTFNTNINIDYVLKILKFYETFFRNNKKGAAIPHLDKNLFANIVVGLPPLAEQQRIVDKLEQIMPLIDQYEVLENELSQLEKEFPENLKKSILQYAVMGKLVEQDKNDEPASELLKRINTEKEQLIKEKKIKKQKALTPITDDEIPFDIPDSWEWVRLNNLCKIITCGHASTPKYVPDGKPFISAKNVKPYRFIPQNGYKLISEELFDRLRKNYYPERKDILLTRVGAGIGEATIINSDLEFAIYVSLTLIKIINYELINNKYILFFLNSPLGVATSINNIYGKGASQGNLNVNNVRNYLIPLPPIKEQQRIVEKVEQLLELCDVIDNKEELKTYHSKFTDGTNNIN
jgi:type I restriction enzyme S subunit